MMIPKRLAALVLAPMAACGPPSESARIDTVLDALVWSEQHKLLASDGADSDSFGQAAVIAGDVAVVSAPEHDGGAGNAGAVYAFVRNGASWSEAQKIASSPPAEYENFGHTLAMDGDTLVVGALGADAGAGAVYVLVRSGTSFVDQQRLTASDGQPGDMFAGSIAISGDTIAVGAVSAAGMAGAAYVFVRSGTVWSEQDKLTALDGLPNDQFGGSVDIAGDTLIAGARNANVSGVTRAGAAYVFVRSGSTWSQQQKLVAANPLEFEELGHAVSVDADTALLGAPKANDNTGRVNVFTRAGSTWTAAGTLVASDGQPGDFLAYVLTLAGDVAAVAAPQDDTPISGAGSVYIFRRSGTQWNEEQRISAADGTTLDYFGDAVALDGDSLLVGVPFDDVNGVAQAGSAYAFVLLGGTCADRGACGSGFCVEGHCCEAGDCGPCGSCALPGAEGRCGPLPLGDPGDGSCAPYACDGQSESCPRSCSEDAECSAGAGCDATGHCVPLGELGATCGADEECASGHCSDGLCCDAVCGHACDRCDLAGHEGSCMVIDCGGFACSAAGTCLTACASTLDCAEGYVCTPDGQCVPRDAGGASDEGCGTCAVGSARTRLAELSLLFLLGACGLRRRGRGKT